MLPVRGMRDFLPLQAKKKQQIEELIRNEFERFGFQPIQTPIVEDFKLLAKKGSGGQAIKEEIYYFKDKSKRELGLRFDLTVSLARLIASNPQLPMPQKIYQISRVYRYDRPQAARYREFTQADADIIGSSSALADFECINLAVVIMKKLGFSEKEFKIKINNRKYIEQIAKECNIKEKQINDCFTILDKIDKIGIKGVIKLFKKKRIDPKILVELKKKAQQIKASPQWRELIQLLEENNLLPFIEIDLTLVRGLDYYTGIVFEVCLKKGPSVGGGGRYDNLIGLYGIKNQPAVGISFGIERLLDALQEKIKAKQSTTIYVFAVAKNQQSKVLQIAQKIRSLGINSDFDSMQKSISKNLNYANKQGIPIVAIYGEEEAKKDSLTIKNMQTGTQTEIKLSELSKLKELIKKI